MDRQELATLRVKIESKYQSEVKRLEQERQALDNWFQEKLAALDVWAGKKTIDEWLGGVGEVALPSFIVSATAHTGDSRSANPPINQAEEIRKAIYSLQINISNISVLKWIVANRPEISKYIQTRSIRSELWRLEKKGKLKIAGKSGNSNIYSVVANSIDSNGALGITDNSES